MILLGSGKSMNWKRRAICSIKRNHKKCFMVFLSSIVLGTVLSSVVSLSRGMYDIAQSLENSMIPVVTFEANWELYLEYLDEKGETEVDDFWTRLPHKTIHEIGELPYVKTFDYSAHMQLFNSDLRRYDFLSDEYFVRAGLACEEIGEPFRLRGVGGLPFVDFEEGLVKIVAGRFFTHDELANTPEVALVSEEFAYLNQLTIGSNLLLKNKEFEPIGGYAVIEGPLFTKERFIGEVNHDLKIIGIFRPSFCPSIDGAFSENAAFFETLSNRIYVPNRFIETMLKDMYVRASGEDDIETIDVEDMVWYQHLFALESPRYISAFQLAAEEIIPPYFRLVDTNNRMRGAISALDSMQQLARTIILSSIGAFVIILTLLIMLFLRDRKEEFGIYLTLGERRRNIICQMIVETMIISILAIVASIFIGHIIAINTFHSLWLNEIAGMQIRDDASTWNQLIGLGFAQLQETTADVLIANYNTTLDLPTILLFISIATGAVLFATVIPIAYLLRMNPKKIMM